MGVEMETHRKVIESHPVTESCDICVFPPRFIVYDPFHKSPNSENHGGTCGRIPALTGSQRREGMRKTRYGYTFLDESASIKQYPASPCWAVFVVIMRPSHSHSHTLTHRQWQLPMTVVRIRAL